MTDAAFDTLFADLERIEKENYRSIYTTVDSMLDTYSFLALPLYAGASDIQLDFEANVKTVLKSAHNQYIKRTADGETADEVLRELIEMSLSELKQLSDR